MASAKTRDTTLAVSAAVTAIVAVEYLRHRFFRNELKEEMDKFRAELRDAGQLQDETRLTRPERRATSFGDITRLDPVAMERGRAAVPRPVGTLVGPKKTKVTRIALTGGPCAGKTSALKQLIEKATAVGFDVLTTPEIATLFFNSSYQVHVSIVRGLEM